MANKFDPKELSGELLQKIQACRTPEELAALAKENDIALTAEQAEAHLAELNGLEVELSDEQLDKIAGGGCGWYYD